MAADNAALKRVRFAALRCPYRDAATQIQVRRQPDGQSILVRFRAWSHAAASKAEEHLRASLKTGS